MRDMLDAAVLIALLDATQVQHTAAGEWLSQNIRHGWASCSITQNDCVRILAQRVCPDSVPAAEVARLREALRRVHHAFVADGVGLLDDALFNWSWLPGPRQVADAYLLALAVRNKGRFVTFHKAVPLAPVPDAGPRHLVVI
ncbi:MAG TPA: TA system VapC family ribonuclease toxin [Rudaea sp.]|nr:TA system VapC family ribonuclease toxin [Rudaea sp.]